MFRESVLMAGFASDLKNPNDYTRWEVAGKSLLLTRDKEGKFRAFENCCRPTALVVVVVVPHEVLG